MLVSNQQCLAFHHHFHFLQAVADQCRPRTHNIKDSICQADSRSNLHRTGNDMNICMDTILLHKFLQDTRIRSSNLATFKPRQSRIIHILGNGQRQTAFAESQPLNDFRIFFAFYKLILAYDTQIRHTTGYRLGNIIITKKKHLDGEIG